MARTAIDADEEEDAFHDASRDVAEREDLVLPLEERDQHDRRADVRDDQDQFHERAEVDAVVGTVAGDVPLRIVENGLKEHQRRDRGDEGNEVQGSNKQRKSFSVGSRRLLSSLAASADRNVEHRSTIYGRGGAL
jgi:hypothetical protein